MYLKTPTIQELQTLDLPTLLDMLIAETANYSKLFDTDGVSGQATEIKETLTNIQTAIQIKRRAENTSSETAAKSSANTGAKEQ